MDPNQPPPAPQPGPPLPPQSYPAPPQPTAPHDPYGFIMEPPKAPKKMGGGGVSGNPFIMRLLLLVGGAVVLMFVIGLVVNIFFGNRTNTDDIVSLTQTQEEIIRVAQTGAAATSNQTLKNAATSTQLTVATQQQAFLSLAKKEGRGIDAKELKLKLNKDTDTLLADAKATSTYDAAILQVMREALTAYHTELKQAHDNSVNADVRAILSASGAETQLLLAQWPEK